MATSSIDLSIITATWKRPKFLAHLLDAVARQTLGGIQIEHLVISDGPDPVSRAVAAAASCRYHELQAHGGHYGAACKDRGIALAQGRYLCFWDDDNLYEPHAAATLLATAAAADLGIVRARHWSVTSRKYVLIPRQWRGKIQPGDIDTLCVCVKRELASQEPWFQPEETGRGTDHRWLSRILSHHPVVHYAPVCVGTHLAFD